MAVPSPVGDLKIVSPIGTFVLNTLMLRLSAFFFILRRRVGKTYPICHNPLSRSARYRNLAEVIVMCEQNPYLVWFSCRRKIRCNVNMAEVNKLYFYGGFLTVAGVTLSSFLFL